LLVPSIQPKSNAWAYNILRSNKKYIWKPILSQNCSRSLKYKFPRCYCSYFHNIKFEGKHVNCSTMVSKLILNIIILIIALPLFVNLPRVVSSIIREGLEVIKNLALHVNYKWQMFDQLIAQLCIHETQSTKCVLILYKSQDGNNCHFYNFLKFWELIPQVTASESCRQPFLTS